MISPRLIACFCLLLLPTLAHARLDVVDLSLPKQPGDLVRFPLVTGEPKAVADRINTWLQFRHLEVVADHYKVSPLDQQTPDSHFASFEYVNEPDTATVVSIGVSWDYVGGAHGDTGQEDMAFDAHSGRVIGLTDIVSSKGLARLQKAATNERVRTIGAHVRELKKSKDAAFSKDEIAEITDIYEKCSDDMAERDLADFVQYQSISMKSTEFVIAEQCSFAWAIRGWDDLGDMKHTTKFADFIGYLTPYGRCLFIDHGTQCARSGVAEGTYHGTIGRTPITVVTERWHGSAYWYDRYNTPIKLDWSEVNGTAVTLKADNETFDLTLQPDGSLKGQWSQPGKLPQPVVLR
jgi:hypothetical protein